MPFLRKRPIVWLLLLVLLGSIVWLIASRTKHPLSRADYVRLEGTAIGTTYRVVARLPQSEAPRLRAALDSLFDRMEASMSIFDSTSLLSRLNRNETDSTDLYIRRMLELAGRVNRISGGLYDVTVKPLTEAWGFAAHARTVHPNVDSLLRFVGFDKVHVEGDRLRKEDPRVQLDFNSIAKGYTVDCAGELVERFGTTDYLVDIGGEIVCRGSNPGSSVWRIGIDSPYDGNMSPGSRMQVVLGLTDCGIATSGNYRRYYLDEQGQKIAHTINPLTGHSAVSNLLSVTVVASTSAYADAMGTMFMLLGAEQARQLAERLASEVEVYLIYSDYEHDTPGNYRVWFTPGFEKWIVR